MCDVKYAKSHDETKYEKIRKLIRGPVYPIPPAFNKDYSLDLDSVAGYVDYLNSFKVRTIMVTAGTSRLNLLSKIGIFIFAPCNVFHIHRLPVSLSHPKQKKMFFTIFPIGRESRFIKKITDDLMELITNGIRDYYGVHGKPALERWERTHSEIASEFETEIHERVEPVETKRLCYVLEHDLNNHFSKRFG